MRINQLAILFALALATTVLGACNGTGGRDADLKAKEAKDLIGIWKIYSIKGNLIEIGDQKGFIDFMPDHRSRIRTGVGLYEYGAWKINTETTRIFLGTGPDTTQYVEYVYNMWADSMTMSTDNNNGNFVTLHCVKAKEYPIDPATEGEVFPY